MKFGWIKKLFKNKSNINSNSSDISTIDISHIKVPKISDLIKEDQDKVKEYLNEIKYEEYETIVKYSNHLLDKSNIFFLASFLVKKPNLFGSAPRIILSKTEKISTSIKCW